MFQFASKNSHVLWSVLVISTVFGLTVSFLVAPGAMSSAGSIVNNVSPNAPVKFVLFDKITAPQERNSFDTSAVISTTG